MVMIVVSANNCLLAEIQIVNYGDNDLLLLKNNCKLFLLDENGIDELF